MSSDSQVVLQMGIYPHKKRENGVSYADGFRGIKTGVTIAFLLVWIPLAVIYVAAGWWYVIGYGALLTAAAALVGTALKICQRPKCLSKERTLKVLSG